MWHYFVTDLVYIEEDGTEIECYVNIDVKQNDEGNWFHSFAIEKGSHPTEILSAVTDESAMTSIIIVSQPSNVVNASRKNSLPLGTRAGAAFDPDAAIARGGKRVKKVNMTVAQLSKTLENNTRLNIDRTDVIVNRGIDNGAKSEYNYTEEQYNRFGWATYNGVMTFREMEDLQSKLHNSAERKNAPRWGCRLDYRSESFRKRGAQHEQCACY